MSRSLQFLDDGTSPKVYVSSASARVIVLPVPLEKTTSYLSGAAAAPKRILYASRQVELFDPELNISPYRVGIHTIPPLNCRGDMETSLKILRRTVGELVKEHKVPVCLGGEHTLSLAPIQALRERYPDLSIFHLDAHADLRDSYGGSGWSHACVMRRVYELGLPAVSVGVRSLSEEEAHFIKKINLPVYPGWEYAESGYPYQGIIESLSDQVYISVDMDVFDPSEVPGVGTPEPGGLRWHQALKLFRTLRDSGKKIVGFDLVELCPQKGSIISEFFAARLLYKMIGYFCLDSLPK